MTAALFSYHTPRYIPAVSQSAYLIRRDQKTSPKFLGLLLTRRTFDYPALAQDHHSYTKQIPMSLLAPIELTPRSKASLEFSSSSLKKENISTTPGSSRSSPSRSARPAGYLSQSSPISRLWREATSTRRSIKFSDFEFGTPPSRSSPKHRRYRPYRRPAPKVDPTDPNQLVRKPQFSLPAYPTPQSTGSNGTPKSILKTTGRSCALFRVAGADSSTAGPPINLAQTLFEGTKCAYLGQSHWLYLMRLCNSQLGSQKT